MVVSGYYSDYRMRAPFSNRSDAEAYIKEVDLYDGRIEEMVMDSGVTHYRKGESKYQVIMHRDGRAWANCTSDDQNKKTGFHLERVRKGSKNLFLVVNTWATSQQHAIKIANDKRAHLIAMRQWRIGVSSDR